MRSTSFPLAWNLKKKKKNVSKLQRDLEEKHDLAYYTLLHKQMKACLSPFNSPPSSNLPITSFQKYYHSLQTTYFLNHAATSGDVFGVIWCSMVSDTFCLSSPASGWSEQRRLPCVKRVSQPDNKTCSIYIQWHYFVLLSMRRQISICFTL